MKRITFFILLSVIAFSCSRHDDVEYLLTKAQAIMETYPDSALMYTDSIVMPEKSLTKEKYMEYLVTKVQAKYKNYDDIREDTNIFEAKHYFDKKRNNKKYHMYAYLYSGCVYDERGEYENALRDYKTAFILAENMNDSLYMWRINSYIAEVFYNETYYNDALRIYKKSVDLATCNEDKANSYADLCRVFYTNNENDSALYYLKRAINIAESTKDEKTIALVYQNAYVFYSECDEPELAIKYLTMSYEKNNDALKENLYILNFLSYYLKENDMISAKLYQSKLKKELQSIEDVYLRITACDAFVNYYSLNNMYDSALYYQKELTYLLDGIYKRNLEQNIYDVQKKYDYELQQNVYQKRLNKRLLILICILLTLLLVLIVSFVLITNSRRREKLLSEQLEDLSNVNDCYEKIKYEINESLKNSLKERFNIIRKVSIIEHNNKTDENLKKIKEYTYGSINKTAFEASVCVIESAYNNITSFIKDTYPELTETEYKVCLLSIAPISVNDIAVISGLSIDTISKSRSNIRKKLKIEDNKRTSISEYILEEKMNIDLQPQSFPTPSSIGTKRKSP